VVSTPNEETCPARPARQPALRPRRRRGEGVRRARRLAALLACEVRLRVLAAEHRCPAAATDGNPATTADPAWTPLLPPPPYPDYTGIDLDVSSSVTGTTRHFDTVAALDAETMNARIWLGFHFRRAMTDGNLLGHRAAEWTIAHELRPTR
jgi:hypothetical protein